MTTVYFDIVNVKSHWSQCTINMPLLLCSSLLFRILHLNRIAFPVPDAVVCMHLSQDPIESLDIPFRPSLYGSAIKDQLSKFKNCNNHRNSENNDNFHQLNLSSTFKFQHATKITLEFSSVLPMHYVAIFTPDFQALDSYRDHYRTSAVYTNLLL